MKLDNNLLIEKKNNLKVKDEVLFSGFIYTLRDRAHKRLVDLINKGKKLPIDLKGKIIYYCGPSSTPKGKIIGSCGPTTSSRMDSLTKPLIKEGLLAMIGKGRRSNEIIELIKRYKAIYFLAPSGCGALLSKRVLSKRLVCFKDLGPEAIYELEVKDFPLIVGIDIFGNSIY